MNNTRKILNYRHDLNVYVDSLKHGEDRVCEAIEEKYGLFGFPPEIVCACLTHCLEGGKISDIVG